ncbi:hypothetical protein Sango_2821500 [Sesamum angolense]|uniref:Uncharacterized protein n=1 Tax=Sesamum angolense TaxID=2727404 RepID=A0AAE1VZQ8_9LAMI|nr:hypothetical protein Sango_2821500 [Sesamum angolense]
MDTIQKTTGIIMVSHLILTDVINGSQKTPRIIDPIQYSQAENVWKDRPDMYLFHAKCALEAIFNLKDSNYDAGGFYAGFPSLPPPMVRPTSRDQLVDIEAVYQFSWHQVHFATSASPVLRPKTSSYVTGDKPIFLKQTHLVSPLHNLCWPVQHHPCCSCSRLRWIKHKIAAGITNVIKWLANMLKILRKLYLLGGRTFLVLNPLPVCCYSSDSSPNSFDIDSSGCMTSFNNAVKFNSGLKEACKQTRNYLHDGNVMYIDTHSLLLEPLSTPHVMQEIRAFCDYGGGSKYFHREVFCRCTKEINGKKATLSACSDPQNYVSWAGVNLAENAIRLWHMQSLADLTLILHSLANQYRDIQTTR